MKNPKYFLSPSPDTQCPTCGSKVLMLATYDVTDAAAFYVCGQDGHMDSCRFIGQIGVGPVPKFEEVQPVPEPELTPEQESFYINAAREAYAKGSSDDVAVDDDAKFSETDNGVWVSGWLWIAKPLCEQCGEPYDASKGDPWAMCSECITHPTCDQCKERYEEAKGDGYCGLCPKCADATEPAPTETATDVEALLKDIQDEADHIIGTDAANHKEVALQNAKNIKRWAKEALAKLEEAE